MKKRYRVLISGRVQGVFFRAETQRVAEELGLTGWVRNTRDGKVEAVFEGEEGALSDMLKWCHRGPALARVAKVEVEEEPFTGTFQDFRITY